MQVCAAPPVGQAQKQTLDPYVAWLMREKTPLFRSGETWWRLYRTILIPASLRPEPSRIGSAEARRLLRESGAYLLRCFTKTTEAPTGFWHVLCDRYDFDAMPSKMRTKIRRAYKDCQVRAIDCSWLAAHGYDCYAAAFSRYTAALPDSRLRFEKTCLSCVGGPFAFWGAFIGEKLVAFAKCVLGSDYVTMVAFKVHPGHASSRPAYALLDAVLSACVVADGKPLNNGFKSLDHDTNMQDFLLQFGFRRAYSDLKVVYRPSVGLLVAALYPFRAWIERAPHRI